jgi:hypothetical protein
MAHRLATTIPFTCVTCEAEISGPPTFHVGLPFCCAGCVASGPCTCTYDADLADDAEVHHVSDIAGMLSWPGLELSLERKPALRR